MAENVEPNTSTLFLEFSRRKLLEQYWPRLRACVESLSDEQVWWRPNESCNGIGNLILHLNGNVGQWLVASFNRLEDRRDRPAEFKAQGGISGAALLAKLSTTMQQASEVLSRLIEADLLASFDIQGYHVTGPRDRVSGGRAFRRSLRPDSLHHENAAQRRSRVL